MRAVGALLTRRLTASARVQHRWRRCANTLRTRSAVADRALRASELHPLKVLITPQKSALLRQ